ncbi:MAG TPA: rod shape-determining protein RodA, partial [Candidatus Eisenbacteria bacterium]|nr:rod shape-determining protein RodA [Candidatus Eisenbacteria bacterium]
KPGLFRDFDKTLFVTPILIFAIGLLSIYSASFKSHQPIDEMLAMKQVLWMAFAIGIVFLVVRTDYFRLQDLAWPLYFLSLALLVLVLFMPARLGAHRWIGVASFNLQPSELAKLSVILVLARIFANQKPEYLSRRSLLVPFAVTGVPFLLILKEPDLGTGLLLIPVLFAMLYVWGFRRKYLFWMVVAAAVLSPILFFFLKDYQKARLLVFVNPNADPLGAGYTIIQSKIAIGSGGFWGKGFMSGTQNTLNFLPERHTDFIFGVIGEEGGFAASAAIVILFALIAKKGYTIAGQTPDRFGSQIACGLTTLLTVQAVTNLGMTMGILPVVGVPLPLVSYGGTSLVMTMVCIGLLLNIKMRRPLF